MEKVTKEFYATARSDKEFNDDLKNQNSLFFLLIGFGAIMLNIIIVHCIQVG